MIGTKTPRGLKNKTIIRHTTTITEVKNKPHQKTITHPQAPPPLEPPQPHTKFFCGSEGLIGPPLPHLYAKNVPAVEHLLYGWRHQDICTAKDKQI